MDLRFQKTSENLKFEKISFEKLKIPKISNFQTPKSFHKGETSKEFSIPRFEGTREIKLQGDSWFQGTWNFQRTWASRKLKILNELNEQRTEIFHRVKFPSNLGFL